MFIGWMEAIAWSSLKNAIDPPMPKSVLIQRVGLIRKGGNLFVVVVSGRSCTWLENVM